LGKFENFKIFLFFKFAQILGFNGCSYPQTFMLARTIKIYGEKQNAKM